MYCLPHGHLTPDRRPKASARETAVTRHGWSVVLLLVFLGAIAAMAEQDNGITNSRATQLSSLRITSPLGRTGLVTKLRIVAQIQLPDGITLSPVAFFVDGVQVGTVAAGPPYAVDWTDANPFEPREIVVQASDSAGHVLRDLVVLPAFEITDQTDVTSILLETGIYDKKGDFINNMDSAAFSVTENGVPQTIDLVARESIPTNLVLLVDNSQSMSLRMDFVRRAAERAAGTLRERDRIILAPFNAHLGRITGPTNDPSTIAQAIRAMRAGGGTAVLDGVVEATRLLQGMDGRRAIVLITDGYDENSTTTLDEAVRAAEQAHVTVYVIGVGGVAGISLKGKDMLKRMTDRTGGRIFFPPRELDLASVAAAVSTDVHSRYLITYTPVNQKRDGTWRQVSVDVPGGYTVRTRAGYFAPAPPPIRPAIEFTVMDVSRNYVDVTAEDLEVQEDGVLQSVDTFQEAVEPVSIVMALDSSGSMKKAAEAVKATARDFVLAARPEDSLALITFADVPKFEHVLGTTRQFSLDAIDKYAANGGTALYDALWNSLLHLKDVAGRRAVVLLSDGRDENNPGTAPGSTHRLDEVLELQRQVQAVIYTVGLGTKLERDFLERLATESGGQAYFAPDASTLGEQFHRVVEGLRRRYVLGYTSTNSEHNGAWRKVEIQTRRRGDIVSTRGGYFAPSD